MQISFDFNNIEFVFLVVIFALFIVQIFYYIFLYSKVLRYMKSVDKGAVSYADKLQGVSVIVYAKNDAEHLAVYLPQILTQNYSDFEVIVVNDGSTDETRDIVTRLESEYDNLYQTYVPDEARSLSRKKLALTVGIKAAKYDIVILTNANCSPMSKNWLSHMMRNFVDGIDIVAGYAYMDGTAQRKRRYIAYDRLMFVLRYVSYILFHKTYMAEGYNLAYRKELFFNNKGFSRHLNLHYGDDDLFINEVATSDNTRVELSPESRIGIHYEDNFKAWQELKLRYDFTSGYLKTSSKFVFGFERFTVYLFYFFALFLFVYGLYHNLFFSGVAFLLWLIRFVVQVVVYRKTAKRLSSNRLFFLLPVFDLMQTFVNIYYRIVGACSRSKNFTWKTH